MGISYIINWNSKISKNFLLPVAANYIKHRAQSAFNSIETFNTRASV